MSDGEPVRTINVGYVHVLYAHGAGCVPHCPHPDHYEPSSAVGPAHDWMPPRTPENVECSTCGGTRVIKHRYRPNSDEGVCPTCSTPENVENENNQEEEPS